MGAKTLLFERFYTGFISRRNRKSEEKRATFQQLSLMMNALMMITDVATITVLSTYQLLDDNEGIVLHDTLAHLHADSLHRTVFFGFDVVGHLHGFKHQ